MKRALIVGWLLILVLPVAGQGDYQRVLSDRADKIVRTLTITDSLKYGRVRSILVSQYAALGKIHDQSDARVKAIKASAKSRAEKDSLATLVEAERNAALYQLHCAFVASLYGELSHEQVEAVKNGMTYNVLNVTYKAQLEMIPRLTDEEKRQIYTWLLEAREHAMDAASSEAKHGWFGKYKGRINNYLSARGYDLNKERADWNERLKLKK
ncbi:MAG: DUF3826 domain-containing protein [Bacteroidota bacterium]|nr:DUF3826 domain-containing protein [Bacteroidota bacterium]